MKPHLAIIIALLLAHTASAHIGSPNVFFDGNAGPHSVRVIIRPPVTLPGIAQVDIRTGAVSASVRPISLDMGIDAAPPAVAASAVPGDAQLFSAPVWLLHRGNYAIRITLDGASVDVPLQAASFAKPEMPAGLGTLLAALGTILFAGAVAIAGYAAGKNRLPVMMLAAAWLTIAIIGGGMRWRRMDADFRNNSLAKPISVEAGVRTEDGRHFLHLTPRDAAASWSTLVTDHGKLMHLFLVAEKDARVFAHLHPVRRDARGFESVLPALPPGGYALYAEVTHENATAEILVGRIDLPAPLGEAPQTAWTMSNEVWCMSPPSQPGDAAKPGSLDADDSWHAGPPSASRSTPLMGGGRMLLQTPGDFTADRDMTLRFAVLTPGGGAANLQTYMGMAGHCVLRRSDGAVFTHLHPSGSISMAAQQLISPSAAAAPAAPPTNEITFPYAFPQPGEYRAWVQIRAEGRVLTGVFDLRVR